MGMPYNESYETYLGLPLVVRRSKAMVFETIKENVHKLKGWKDELFPAVGKEVLVKVIARAILAQC